jgi:hypothetical protein
MVFISFYWLLMYSEVFAVIVAMATKNMVAVNGSLN